MPAFDVTTNPTKLDPLKPGGKATIVVTATNQLPRAVTARAQQVVEPATYDALVKPPPNPQRTFSQKGATQDFPFTIEIPADAKAGSFTTRFDVVDREQPNDNFGQSPALKVVIEVPPPPPPPDGQPKPWWFWVLIGLGVVILGIVLWILFKPKHKMPDVVGMAFTDAQAKLAKDSIRIVRVDTLNADTSEYKGNEVIEQKPVGGTKLNPDTNLVRLVVQKPYTVVPVVKHLTDVAAAGLIGAADLGPLGVAGRCQTATSPDNGKVVDVSPAESTLVAQNSPVTITLLSVQPTCLRRLFVDEARTRAMEDVVRGARVRDHRRVVPQ